jgi:hypothetical protein
METTDYEPIELDEFHAHEALDRTFVIRDQFEMFVVEHPFIMQNEDLANEAEKISSSFFDFYQAVANKSWKMFKKENTSESEGNVYDAQENRSVD